MMYKEFFRIEIDHQYFLSGGVADLTIVPNEHTLRFLKGQHFICAGTTNGVKVLIPINENGSTKPIFCADDVLIFNIFPTTSTFGLFTDLSDLSKGEIFRFTNEKLPEATSELVSSISVDNGSLNGFRITAKVEIHPTDALLSGTNLVPYKVIFKARLVPWKYYLVSDKETTDLAVKDLGNQFVFNHVNINDDTSDQIGMSLRLNYPEANLLLFESDTPLVCSNQVLKNLQLLRDNEVIIKHLPNPDIGDEAIKIIKIYKED